MVDSQFVCSFNIATNDCFRRMCTLIASCVAHTHTHTLRREPRRHACMADCLCGPSCGCDSTGDWSAGVCGRCVLVCVCLYVSLTTCVDPVRR